MRRQYHFRPTGPRFDAWDVHRLIRLSAGLPPRTIPLERIREVDTAYWALPGAPHPTVREMVVHLRLVLAVDPVHPVILGSDGRLMDGMHRIALALLEGRTEIAAVRFDVDPEPDHHDIHPEDLSYDEDTSA